MTFSPNPTEETAMSTPTKLPSDVGNSQPASHPPTRRRAP